MKDCKPCNVPVYPETELYIEKNRNEGDFERIPHVMYMKLIGSLLYLANTTRTDIAFACSVLSHQIQHPRRMHWNAAKSVLRYLKGSHNLGIFYKVEGETLHGFTDFEFAGHKTDHKSTSGYVFIQVCSAISWRSNKKTIVV